MLVRGLRRRCGSPANLLRSPRKANITQKLRFPIRLTGRIAVCAAGFRRERGMREFAPDDFAGIAAFSPHAIVAPLPAALAMASLKIRARLAFPDLQTALVVLTDAHGEPLSEHHRDILWRAFGVPVFEQLRDARGVVIARECEVHDGLHFPGFAAIPLPCDVETAPCECGDETRRLRNLQPAHKTAAAAA